MEGLFDSLPDKGHYIFNKKVCGCGATELFLGCDKKCILASPRKNLLYNKYSQHLLDNYHLFRYNGDKDKYFSNGSISSSETVTYKDNLRDYVRGGGTKILTTYDSLKHILEILQDEKQDLNEWNVVVDEFQVMFYDCHFKATTEYEFYKLLQGFPNVVFLSATPFLEEYLDQLDFFKVLTIYELEWLGSMIEKPGVKIIRTSQSITKLCEGIIEKYRKGEGETALVDGKEIKAKEAVFYINSVKEIVKVIKVLNIKPEEVNIICSSTSENTGKLKELPKEKGKDYKIGDIPGKGETHKMFTFCTSTVYVGADFYSNNAYSYIFANPHVESLTIDVSVDIQQIIGRQRLDSNPFKNKATLYFKTKASDMTEEAMKESIRLKNEKTTKQIENFNSAPHKDDFIEGLNKKPNHKENYCCISKDEKGKQIIEKNPLLELADRRAWEITNKIYNNDLSMFTALSVNMNVTKDIDSNDSEVNDLFREWNKLRNFKDRVVFYCEACKNPEVLNKCCFIPAKYKEYYEALGEEGMKELGWREDYIKNAIAPIPFEQRPNDEIMGKLKANLKERKFYAKSEIKELLCNIFKELRLKGKPSASDVSFYIDCEEKSKRVDGKKVVGYQVISYYKKRVSLFKRISDVKNPIQYNLDDILEMIRTGKQFDLKKKVQDVRNAKDKDEKDRMKIRLPAVTWNGIFESKNKNCLLVYSSYTALDFDHIPKDEMPGFIDKLKKSSHVYAGFRTSSGEGYKAIILHDNLEPSYHDDLYERLLTRYNCGVKDTSTRDLARGNYLSYDPDLWINPDAVPFHFVPSTPVPKENSKVRTETVIKTETGEEILVQDDDEASGFLLKLRKQVISDETIIKFLKGIWTGKAIGQGRNNTAMSYAGVLCKAGIEKSKAKEVIKELIPGFDISEIIRYAYSHNIYGCERRRYIRKKNG